MPDWSLTASSVGQLSVTVTEYLTQSIAKEGKALFVCGFHWWLLWSCDDTGGYHGGERGEGDLSTSWWPGREDGEGGLGSQYPVRGQEPSDLTASY